MKARTAQPSDFDKCYALGERYLPESFYRGATINPEGWKRIFFNAINNAHTARMIVVDDGDRIVGFAYIAVSYDMILEGVGEVSLFYIEPESRNGRASILLRDEVIKAFETDLKCGYAIVACSSGVSLTNNAAYTKLWQRSGFSFLGTDLFKRFEGE
jgi:hypothetical protein